MTQAQVGDLSQRLRRLTGAVGNVPLGILDSAAPVIVIANLEQPGYSREPRTFGDRISVGAGAAGNVGMIAVQAQPGTVVSIDSIFLEGQAVAQYVLLYLQRNQVAPMVNYTVSQFAMDCLNNPAADNTVGSQVGHVLARIGSSNANLLVPPGAGADNFTQISAGTGTSVSAFGPTAFPNPVVLFGSKPGANPTGDLLILVATTGAQAFAASVFGREWSLQQGVGI